MVFKPSSQSFSLLNTKHGPGRHKKHSKFQAFVVWLRVASAA